MTCPVLRSNCERCRGQITLSSRTKPRPRSVSSCVHVPPTAETSPPTFASSMCVPFKSTAEIEPSGRSETFIAETNSPIGGLPVLVVSFEYVLGLFDLGCDLARRGEECLPVDKPPLRSQPFAFDHEPGPLSRLLYRYVREDRLEESQDYHLLCLVQGEAPRHHVEELLFVYLSDRGRVGRFDFVVINHQTRDPVGLGRPVEDHGVVGQVGPRIPGRIRYLDHTLEYRLRLALQHAPGMDRPSGVLADVDEVRFEIKPLLCIGEEYLETLCMASSTVEEEIHPRPGDRGTQGERAHRRPRVIDGFNCPVRHVCRLVVQELDGGKINVGSRPTPYLGR